MEVTSAVIASAAAGLGLLLAILGYVIRIALSVGDMRTEQRSQGTRLVTLEVETKDQSRQLVSLSRAVAVIEALDEKTGKHAPLAPTR